MGFRRTSLVFYILFIFHLQHNFPCVSSRHSSVDTNYETLPFDASNPNVVGFQGKAQDLVVVIKKRGGGGRGGGGGGRSWGRGGGSRGSKGGGSGSDGGRSRSRDGIGNIPFHAVGGGSARSHHSCGGSNLRGPVYTFGWLALSVIAGLFLVQ